jgi:alanine racemase
VEVNLDALEHNARLIRNALPPNVALMAIVKADAYGHGAVMSIPTLEASGVSMVGVASMDEALQIRHAGLEIPILVIGAIPDWSVQMAAEQNIQLTVFAQHQLDSLKNAYPLAHRPFKVHIKVDTGMHRIGVDYREAVDFIRHCQSLPYLHVEGIFTHLACAEDPAVTQIQHQRWLDILNQVSPLPRYVHFGNSLGALGYDAGPNNLVRVGLAFYGYLPGTEALANETATRLSQSLRPVMSLKARIMRLHEVPPDTGISYSYAYRTREDGPTLIATLPLGYADGVPRRLSNQISGLLKGKRVPQVGNITMDQMMLDVSAVPHAVVGEAVTLIGEEGGDHTWLTDWAQKLGTLEYELMCGLRVRLPKTYTRH